MKNILLMGLTDHEAAAVEIMIGMNWRDHRCVTLKRDLSLAVPEQNAAARGCEACVLDLFGLGMRKHSPENAKRLLEVLAGRSAVLLTWGQGGGWLEAKLPLAMGQHVAWVSMPYTSAGLRDAIKKVKDAADKAPRPRTAIGIPKPATPAVRPTVSIDVVPETLPPVDDGAPAAVPAWRRAMDLADQIKRKATPSARATLAPAQSGAAVIERAAARAPAAVPASRAPAPVVAEPVPAVAQARPLAATSSAEPLSMAPPAVRMASDAVGLGSGALQALLHVFPVLHRHPYMALTARIVEHDGPLILHLGGDAAFVTNARQGWLASGLPVSALLKLLRTPALVEGVEARALDPDQVEETVRQRFAGRFHRAQKPLDVITWELMSDVLKDTPLQHQGDLTFQLRRFPNFPMLADVGPLDVQLAAICARMPQSVSELLRAFPKHPQDVQRFVVLCVVSGLAKVIPTPAHVPMAAGQTARAPAPAQAPARKPEVAARRGFFKSLMDKLF